MTYKNSNEIKNYIETMISDQNYKIGDKLPSCRALAMTLNVNKLTVQKAYQKLERTHKVYAVKRGGYYVAHSSPEKLVDEEVVDFNRVIPERQMIPYALFLSATENAMQQYKNAIFNMDQLLGLDALRVRLSMLYSTEGLNITKDQIMITNGIQQGIHLILQHLFLHSSKTLLVESPTYSLALELAQVMRIKIKTIERRPDGYDMKVLEDLFKEGDIKAFYLIPRHHNPTGYSLDEKSKRAVVKLADQYGVILIEDDFLADLSPKNRQMPLHYYNLKKNQFYLRSFSKTFIPGIRIGAMIFPDDFSEDLKHLKHLNDLNTSKLNQAALEVFIASGMYEKHIQSIRKHYAKKMKLAKSLLKPSPKINWHIPEGGIFIWGEFDEKIPLDAIIEQLRNEGIYIKSGVAFGSLKPSVRISIIGVPSERLAALERVQALFNQEAYKVYE